MRTRPKPADTVIRVFGGLRPAARALGCHPTTVWGWFSRGGNVPHEWHPTIIREAEKRGYTVTLEDLAYWDES